MPGPKPAISALVCTRNRPEGLERALRSILAIERPAFELIVVDQSDDERTAEAVAGLGDTRLRYIRHRDRGLGKARNLGLREARADVVAMTDDDCEVREDWLQAFEAVFARFPEVAVAFCAVSAGPHDARRGRVPCYERKGEVLIGGLSQWFDHRGMGAGMAVRAAAMRALGGFDEHLVSYEDRDIAVRALVRGGQVYATDATSVVHHGFRTWEENLGLAERDVRGTAEAHAKYLRGGPGVRLRAFTLREMWRALFRQRGPRALLRATARFALRLRLRAYARGLAIGWRLPLDRALLRYR